MKLVFDENLSFKLAERLSDLFPGSTQVRLIGFSGTDDRTIWNHAKINGFALVSRDVDFAEMATLLGPPPKVIWLRGGNQSTRSVEETLRRHAEAIAVFEKDLGAFDEEDRTACLEIY
jgi:predicted nuclease of predicted toxin-antitoxin system